MAIQKLFRLIPAFVLIAGVFTACANKLAPPREEIKETGSQPPEPRIITRTTTVVVYVPATATSTAPCGNHCGSGTHCDAAQKICVPNMPRAEPAKFIESGTNFEALYPATVRQTVLLTHPAYIFTYFRTGSTDPWILRAQTDEKINSGRWIWNGLPSDSFLLCKAEARDDNDQITDTFISQIRTLPVASTDAGTVTDAVPIDARLPPDAGGVTDGGGVSNLVVGNYSTTGSSRLLVAGTRVNVDEYHFFAYGDEKVVDYVTHAQNEINLSWANYRGCLLLEAEDEAGNVLGSVMPNNFTPTIGLEPNSLNVKDTDVMGKRLSIKCQLAQICPGCAINFGGFHIGYSLTTVQARSLASGNTAEVVFSAVSPPIGETHYMFKGIPRAQQLQLDNRGRLQDGPVQVAKYRLSSDGMAIEVGKNTWRISLSSGVRITELRLNDITTSTVPMNLFRRTNINIATASVAPANFNRPTRIGSSSSRTFELVAVVSGSVPGSTVSTVILGDRLLPHHPDRSNFPGTLAQIESNPSNRFIWSDISFEVGHTALSADWVNGFAVPGLPSDGGMEWVVSR